MPYSGTKGALFTSFLRGSAQCLVHRAEYVLKEVVLSPLPETAGKLGKLQGHQRKPLSSRSSQPRGRTQDQATNIYTHTGCSLVPANPRGCSILHRYTHTRLLPQSPKHSLSPSHRESPCGPLLPTAPPLVALVLSSWSH